jgi:hypothetical protein
MRGYGRWSFMEKLGGTIITRERFPDGIERNVYALPDPLS